MESIEPGSTARAPGYVLAGPLRTLSLHWFTPLHCPLEYCVLYVHGGLHSVVECVRVMTEQRRG